MQVVPPRHACPHDPQLVLLVDRLTHVPAQSVCPEGHAVTHVPLLHAVPAAHAVPHPPQFVVLVSVFTHVPLHSVVPAGH